MSMERIRAFYGVPAKRGMRIIHEGSPCTITGTTRSQMYLRVRFDDEPGRTYPIHPTSGVEYPGGDSDDTTDTDALTERLWDAITEIRDDFPRSHRDAPTTLLISDAVLPIVAVEVRKAKAEALRETADWWAANPDDDAFETDRDTRNWLRDVAAEYEAGGSDEHR